MSAEDYIKLSVRYRIDFTATGTSPMAELLFVRAMAYSGLCDTKGFIPRPELAAISPGLHRVDALVEELVAHDYWQPAPNGWVIRSWAKWQHEFDDLQERRIRDAQRKRDARRKAREEAS